MPGTGFRLHSVLVHSREHSSLNSGLNSGMAQFRRNQLSPESTGMTGFQQESVGQGKDLRWCVFFYFFFFLKNLH